MFRKILYSLEVQHAFPTFSPHVQRLIDKHGQLGIWDARAPREEVEDEDGDVSQTSTKEDGKYWRLQVHWPATSKSASRLRS